MGRIKSDRIKKNTHLLLKKKINIIKKNFKYNKIIVDYFMKLQSKKLRNKFAGNLKTEKERKSIIKKKKIKIYKLKFKNFFRTSFNSLKFESHLKTYYKSYYTSPAFYKNI
ncbi:40S ribosomal protein S17E (nucleomorph) [Lotharella oceanica]|uniref:40S ribosomal protein S17E n=1 Tax=Lotharella oceanica TaxID=641309 RepID=A0A060DAB6_9EUKA|nr:40S ribosomal protein S17E [Lotharella oceanica]